MGDHYVEVEDDIDKEVPPIRITTAKKIGRWLIMANVLKLDESSRHTADLVFLGLWFRVFVMLGAIGTAVMINSWCYPDNKDTQYTWKSYLIMGGVLSSEQIAEYFVSITTDERRERFMKDIKRTIKNEVKLAVAEEMKEVKLTIKNDIINEVKLTIKNEVKLAVAEEMKEVNKRFEQIEDLLLRHGIVASSTLTRRTPKLFKEE